MIQRKSSSNEPQDWFHSISLFLLVSGSICCSMSWIGLFPTIFPNDTHVPQVLKHTTFENAPDVDV